MPYRTPDRPAARGLERGWVISVYEKRRSGERMERAGSRAAGRGVAGELRAAVGGYRSEAC